MRDTTQRVRQLATRRYAVVLQAMPETPQNSGSRTMERPIDVPNVATRSAGAYA